MLEEIEALGRRIDAAISARYAEPVIDLLKDARAVLVAAHEHIKVLSS